jgi:putative hydrolase of HD superfamily
MTGRTELALMLIYSDERVDVDRAIKMSLVHDIAEAIVGDITPPEYTSPPSCYSPSFTPLTSIDRYVYCNNNNRSSGISRAAKHDMERRAIADITRTLSQISPTIATELQSLYDEYESGATPTSLLVKDFDKLDMIIQAYEYERLSSLSTPTPSSAAAATPKASTNALTLQTFFDSTRGKFRNEGVQAVVEQLYQRRTALLMAHYSNTSDAASPSTTS